MKTHYVKKDWLVPIMGVAVLAGCMMAAAAYQRVQREAKAAEALAHTVEHLYQDQNICMALRKIHEGDVAAAAQQLDVLVCDDILHLHADLASADDVTRTYVGDGLRRMGSVRPKTPEASSSGAVSQTTFDQAEAQRILALTIAAQPMAESKGPRM